MKLLLATRNAHKAREISALLGNGGLTVVTLADVPGVPPIDEDRPTLEGNARKKATESAVASGLWALADDTGLEVRALSGAPGVHSARYAGPECSYDDNNRKLLGALAGVTDRRAVFRTVMALSDPRGSRVVLEEGALEGVIAEAPAGANGFGYDPLFIPKGQARAFAEMTDGEKNALSHRARALKAMLPHLKKLAAGALMAVLVLAAPPARAGKTEPGQETIWDQIMASQAHRGLRVGSNYLEMRQYELAEKEFLRAVLANPKDPYTHLLLGAAYYWQGKVDEALAQYQTALGLDPNNAQAYMLTGIAHAWKGKGEESYAAFKKAAELDPARADIQMNLGSIEESLGLMSEALARFRKAITLDGTHPLYYFQLGMLYRRLGRDGDAVDSFKQALKLMTTYEDALLELGAAHERRGERKAAISSFRKAVALKSRDAVARYRLGRLYLINGERPAARDVMREAFHLTPEGEGSGLQLSVSFAGGKRPGQAPPPEGGAGKPPPADPNDPLDVFRRNLERIPSEQGAVMDVDVAYVPKPKLTPKPFSEGSSLKNALERGMKAAEAKPSAKIVKRQFPLKPAAPDERQAQIAKVMDNLRAMMKEAPEDADVRLGMNLTYTRLAEAPAGRGDAEGSPKVSYQPRQVGNDLNLWVMGTGWMALVEEVLPERGDAPAHPDDGDWWVSTGLGYAAIGEGQRALEAFERALTLEPKHELALLGRGVASVMTGNEAIAIASYKQVIDINPKNRAARDGLRWLLKPSGGTGGKKK